MNVIFLYGDHLHISSSDMFIISAEETATIRTICRFQQPI